MEEKKWVVKNNRPEEKYLGKANEYYNKNVSENYSKSKPLQKMQKQITLRAIELAGFEKGNKILDLGAGTGTSMKTLNEKGFKTKGIDVSNEMIKKAKEQGIEIKKADMRKIPFKDKEFDGVISISALQWLIADKEDEEIKKVAKETNRVLKKKGKAIFQFYSKSEEQAIKTAKLFSKQGFETQLITDYPENPKKRKTYILLKKNKELNKTKTL